MKKVLWDDSLSVGVALIDDQHKTLIARLNDVAAAVEERQGPREILKTLDFLFDYTDTHFSTEETHMRATGYPAIEHHLRKHQDLRDTLSDMNQDFDEEGATQDIARAINTLLVNWLLDHIEAVDREFGAYLLEKNIDLTA